VDRPFLVGAVIKIVEPVPLADGGVAEAGTVGRITGIATTNIEGEPTYTVAVLRSPSGWQQPGSIRVAPHRALELIARDQPPFGVVVDCERVRTCWSCGREHLLRYPVYVELGIAGFIEYDCPFCGERQEEADAFAGPCKATPT